MDGAARRLDGLAAYDAAREAGDVEAMTAAALGLVEGQFGTVPGRVPAFLHEAWTRAAGASRARVGIALARVWAYGGDAARAVEFADDALAIAEECGDAALRAGALDAQLLVHWGPDDLAERLRITRRLEDTVVHLTDVEARLSAHLWRLTTALECLDLPALQRQLRGLDLLADESGSPRVRFFAASRRGMAALVAGNLDAAARARDRAVAEGTRAGERDVVAIERELSAGIARQRDDVAALAREAGLFEEFGTGEGIVVIAAEAALLWLAAGRADRAGALLHQLTGGGLAAIPRDVDWTLTLTTLTEVAAATGDSALLEEACTLLQPYAGRGVVNAGGVSFGGVVDEALHRAALALSRQEQAELHRTAAIGAYRRLGAPWWLRRLSAGAPAVRVVEVVHLHPTPGGPWEVGRDGSTAVVPDARGLHHLAVLLRRPGVDVPALELSAAAAGHPGAMLVGGDLGPVLDRRAAAAYRQRLAELDEELDEAHAWHDEARAAGLRSERDALVAELGRATGLGGRSRREGDVGERARVAVRKAIATALDRIEQADPAVARLLRGTVTTGRSCRYEPDPDRPVRWLLDDR